jgi:hypothetical protein
MPIKPIVWMLSLWLFSSVAECQIGRPSQPGSSIPPVSSDDSDTRDRMAHDMAKKANEERAAALKVDTDKLLKLATELKASVDKSNENILSLDVIKKAEEIEKLAHSVKEKMRGPN